MLKNKRVERKIREQALENAGIAKQMMDVHWKKLEQITLHFQGTERIQSKRRERAVIMRAI